MNKNRKLVALICAISMILSLFAGFTVVNAEAKAGIALEGKLSGTTGTVTVKYVGFADGISGAKIVINKPAGAKVTAVSGFDPKDASVTPNDEAADSFTYLIAAQENVKPTNGDVIATITMDLSGVTESVDNYEVKLLNGTEIASLNEDFEATTYAIEDDSLVVAKTALADPSKTPAPTPEVVEATRAPKVTPVPVASGDPSKPTKEPVVIGSNDHGISLDATVSADKKNITITAKYVGFADGISGAKIVINKPAGAKVAAVSGFDPKDASVTPNDEAADSFTYLIAAQENVKPTNGDVIATITMTLDPALTEDYIIELLDGTEIASLNEDFEATTYEVANKTMPACWTTAVAGGGDTPVVTPEPDKKEVAVKDKVDSNKVTGETIDGEGTDDAASDYRLIISVTDKSGNDIPYGDGGFVAKFNGKPLTEAQYKNLVEGYLDPSIGANSMKDIINGLTLEVFADGANVSVKLRDPSGLIVDKGEETVSFGPVKTTPAPKLTVKTKAGSKAETTSKTVKAVDGTTVKVTATYDKPVEGGKYKVAYNNVADKDYLALLTSAESEDGTFRFAVDKAGKSVKLVISYVDGEKELAKSDLTITTIKASDDDTDNDDNGGSSSKGNGGGSIAHGGTAAPNVAGKIAFTDLDTVPWAEDAILALVDKNVLNGRSNTIFDPNGTVTRAEFAKMVVLGFNLTGGSASNFTDVATTDWYAPYVATGYNNGVISGYDDGTFRPNGLISRQEMAAMISRAIAAANKTAPATVAATSFDDAWQIGSWAIDSVTTLQRAGIINGMTATTFEPLANATRAQAAVIINRAITIAR